MLVMTVEQQAAALRAMRAWLGLDQRVVAEGAGIAERTLLDAERARACSDKSWAALTSWYARIGVHWRGGEGPMAILIAERQG